MMKATDPPFTLVIDYNQPIDKVWSALTDQWHMIQWYFEQIPAFEAQVGFKTEFIVVNEGRTFTHQWEVTEVVPGEKITYTWNFPEYPGFSRTTFELETLSNDQTRLHFTDVITEDYPPDVPEFTWESCKGGWDYFLRQRLKEYLN